MKLRYLYLVSIAAYLAVVAFRSALQQGHSQTVEQIVTAKKRLAIRCSPLYIPVAGEEIPLLTGWGNYSWKITSTSDSAQVYFNQGINMYYAFHIIESRASFEKAIRFDPDCAIAWWGKALALGPNINDFGYQAPSAAFAAASKAVELKASATAVEQALIEAIGIRYSADTAANQDKLNIGYRDAMKQLYKRFPNNENICTLYADALMLIHPWNLYGHDFTPKPWTAEIVSVLKHALQVNPKQPGANHYYIHAVEASAKPSDASASAAFLETAMPSVSHITHMPSHVYIRTGVYDKGISVNDDAITGYNKYFSRFAATKESFSLYVLHNLHMKLNCAQMAGNYNISVKASNELQAEIPGEYLTVPGALGNYIQYLHQSIIFTWVRFGKWDEILKQPVGDTLAFTSILQHFARAMAFVHSNNLTEAVKESGTLNIKMAEPSLKEALVPFNSTYSVSLIAKAILDGTIAENKKELNKAIDCFQKAVKYEDDLIYNEPRDWLLPARQYLGNALLKASRYQEAMTVFKKDLQINPNNGWALTGLLKCYQELNNKTAVASIQKRLDAAWSIKDVSVIAAVF
jgi:tetratricopeptide (TPR) repeat protein